MILLDPLARPVIAHRGASGSFPENTLLAFREAIGEGADGVELDVRLSADGVPVVFHDATLDRTTNGRGPVADVSQAALQELDAGSGERIPMLAEVLEELTGTPVIIEVKERRAGARVARVIEAAGATKRVVVGAFDDRALREVRRAGIPTTASRRETTAHWVLARVGLALRTDRYRGFSVPEYSDRLRVVDRRFVSAAHKSGKPVHVWTVDDVAAARRLRAIGVAGILTNFPARMRALSSE